MAYHKVCLGDKIIYQGETHEVLGFAASLDASGDPLIEIAWNNHKLSSTGYLAVPRAMLELKYPPEDADGVVQPITTRPTTTRRP